MERKITINSDDISQEEAYEIIKVLEEKEGRKIVEITITADGEFANCTYKLLKQPFERIRRITGYLVGSLDNWNDAKRAEETDRVKHQYEVEELN